MTVNHLIGGSSLQNELIQLLSNESNEQPEPSEQTELNSSIQQSVSTSNSADLSEVMTEVVSNPDLSGGANISAIIDNVLLGGNSQPTQPTQSTQPVQESQSGSDYTPGEIMTSILLDGGNKSTAKHSSDFSDSGLSNSSEYSDSSLSSDSSEESTGYSSNFANKYISIINEMRESNTRKNVPLLTGGSVKSVQRVKVLNMFPWILKSSD